LSFGTARVGHDMLVFKTIAKHYTDGTVALRDVTLVVPAGQFCVVLGSSGAGKSTLLRLVNGLAVPTHGTVDVAGFRVRPGTLAQIRPRVAMIHQQFNLVARATVLRNVLTGSLPAQPFWRSMAALFAPADQRKACERIAAVGLSELHLNRRVSELSGGQQQRVGIARAFMLDPAVVLADEPVASLDPRTSRDIMALLREESRRRGTTVLCSLHQLDLARAFADRIVALRDGEVVFDGAPGAFDDASAAAVYAERATRRPPMRPRLVAEGGR
jgi:phosphonate transport system ATP-binding protein